MNKNALAPKGEAQPQDPGHRHVVLPDGRRLGYAEYGAPNGTPVLFFHGAPGSRHIHADMADIAARRNVRLIAVERPGYGLSDAQAGRTLLSFADDVAVLVDILGLEKFALIGFSMGSIYALACAYQLEHRISGLALAGALAPLDAPGVTKDLSPAAGGLYALAQTDQLELRSTFAAIAPTNAALMAAMTASVCEWDKSVLLARHSEFETEYAETLRSGIEGMASDFVLASQSWGFPLEGIKTGSHLWIGTADCNAPPAMTTYIASTLPNSQTTILQDEGHCALYAHWDEILARLV